MSRAHRLRCCLALLPTLLPLAAGGCSAPNDDEPTPAGDMAATGERTEPHLNIGVRTAAATTRLPTSIAWRCGA
jgi:hypothetical protein